MKYAIFLAASLTLLPFLGLSQQKEISIDVLPLINKEKEIPNVLVRIPHNNHRGNYRIKLGTSLSNNKTNPFIEQRNNNVRLNLGYEFYRSLKFMDFIYGFELLGDFQLKKNADPHWEANATYFDENNVPTEQIIKRTMLTSQGFGSNLFVGFRKRFWEDFSISVETATALELYFSKVELTETITKPSIGFFTESIRYENRNSSFLNLHPLFAIRLGYQFGK
ncbi:hypothetical protein [Runella limosa]|uniref:hypothetical protein n=1 Tax=Runella limosa TaxID=370978 RepID=UPI000421AC63|nr:hypothetical protein [Runella limosa]